METKLDLLKKRKSVRSYLTTPISKELRDKLNAEATMTNTHVSGIRFEINYDNSDPFKGFFKSYGSFENPRNYLVAIIDAGIDNTYEKAGYYGEKFVMLCVKMGLGTCFVGGTYDPKSINTRLRAGEKILFVILFGYPSGHLRIKEKWLVDFIHRKKYDLKDFFDPADEFEKSCEQFKELREGTEAVSLAPSALNKRPTRLFIGKSENGSEICAKVPEKDQNNLIDLGIAKYNYNFVTDSLCQWGNGAPLNNGIEH